jgi:hypothetical protein
MRSKKGPGTILHPKKDSPATPLRNSPYQSKRMIRELIQEENALDPMFRSIFIEFIRDIKSDKMKRIVRY